MSFTTHRTIIERSTQAGASVYAVMVSSASITFDYMTADGLRFLTTHDGLQIGQWQHLVIQVNYIMITVDPGISINIVVFIMKLYQSVKVCCHISVTELITKVLHKCLRIIIDVKNVVFVCYVKSYID